MIQVTYLRDDRVYTTERSNADLTVQAEESESRIRITLTALQAVRLIRVQRVAPLMREEDDRYFVNGYQSWTYSPEWQAKDRQYGVRGLGRLPIAYTYTSATNDDAFAPRPRRSGEFYGYTYGYVRRAEVVTLYGSLVDRQAFTRIGLRPCDDTVSMTRDLEGIALQAGESCLALDVAVLQGAYDEVFDAYFDMLDVKPRTDQTLRGYTSWYNYFGKIDTDQLMRDLSGLADRAGDLANIFQIDDGWQNKVGDWLELRAPQFTDMRALADAAHARGLQAGLWLAPTLCARDSRTAAEHPDWLLRNAKGKPIIGSVAWGGAYVLDIYHPQVQEYLRRVFDTVCNVWGFDMVKLDFLYSSCMIPRAGKPRGQIMADTVDFLRDCCKNIRILGCGVPLASCWGIFDYCRIGCDVDLRYRDLWYKKHTNPEIISAPHTIADTVFRRHLHGRAFLNDPDVFFLRQNNLHFTDEQKRVLARINALAGGVLFVSDDVGAYDDVALEALKEVWSARDTHIDYAEYTDGILTLSYTWEGQNELLQWNLAKGEKAGK